MNTEGRVRVGGSPSLAVISYVLDVGFPLRLPNGVFETTESVFETGGTEPSE